MIELTITPRTNPAESRKFFQRFMDAIWGRYNRAKYLSAKYVFEELVDSTPVFTGWARASWSAGVDDAPPRGIPHPPPIPGQYPPPMFNAPKKIGRNRDYVIGNDAPHIAVLNAGHSQQAPALFIERAIDIGLARAMAELDRR